MALFGCCRTWPVVDGINRLTMWTSPKGSTQFLRIRMELYNLVVETTRRCNMDCPHCLRGQAQNKRMKKEHLKNFLSQIRYISSVTFTGGEPTLPSGMQSIYDFMDVCHIKGIIVGSFYIATNGMVWRKEIASMIYGLYAFCDDNEVSGIDISNDRFHVINDLRRQNFRMFLRDKLEYYGISNIVRMRGQLDSAFIIEEGRGKQYGTGRKFEIPEILLEDWDDEKRVTEGDIYLNCDGNVIAGCDWSYISQKNPANIICSATDNFEEAITKFIAKEREHHDTNIYSG